MISFVNEETVAKARKRARRLTFLWIALGAAMLILLLVLCLFTRTGNARSMLYAAWISQIALGLAWIAMWMFQTEPARAEARHLEGLLESVPETREGTLTVTSDTFRIPKSVRVRKVHLDTEGDTLSLNLNERLLSQMPPSGSAVRVQTVRKFISAMEVTEKAKGGDMPKRPSALRTFGSALARFFPAAVIWVLLVVIFTGFLFNRLTDTSPSQKITIYADCEVMRAAELAEQLETALDGAVRMVKVHPFSYALFGSEALKGADLYLVPDSRKNEYAEWFLTDEAGMLFHDPESGLSLLGAYFQYTDECYRLYPGARSPHLNDGLAKRAAGLLAELDPAD